MYCICICCVQFVPINLQKQSFRGRCLYEKVISKAHAKNFGGKHHATQLHAVAEPFVRASLRSDLLKHKSEQH